LNHRQAETELSVAKDANNIETTLKAFWDKVRAASELIDRLRKEKQSMGERLSGMGQEILSLQNELQEKDQELKRLKSQLASSSGSDFFTEEEKEGLKIKIRYLMAKINSHL